MQAAATALPTPIALPQPSFEGKTRKILGKMASENEYSLGGYTICHIVPWQFIEDMIKDMINDSENFDTFIDDLATIHTDAAFYKKLSDKSKTDIDSITEEYKTAAKKAARDKDMNMLANTLFNIPSNLFPGDNAITGKIGERQMNPPKKGVGAHRINQATDHAKQLYKSYHDSGLEIHSDRLGRALSSDRPPKNDYITITQ